MMGESNHVQFSKNGNSEFLKNLPLGPKSQLGKKGGVGKNSNRNLDKRNFERKTLNGRSTEKIQKALTMTENPQVVNIQGAPPRARCKKFPDCRDRNCHYAHPKHICKTYPNCPNPPGTCKYLHPSEDADIIASRPPPKKVNDPQVVLCKYGVLCSKELCPFGHPTPANKDAKVIYQQWCFNNKDCTNPQCKKAHSSPNYKAPVAAKPKALTGGYASTLEQCNFGKICTNPMCPRRHALSQVPCREGARCTLPYCTFSHPIEEGCRYGDECKLNPCYFRHPDGREIALFPGDTGKPLHGNPAGPTEKTYAVGDDQVMETVQQ